MDPLSVAASIIAVTQAAVSVGKGLNYLRSLRDVPIEFLDLTNELTTLQAVLQQSLFILNDLDSDKEKLKTLSHPTVDLTSLQTCYDDLNSIVSKLTALCNSLKLPLSAKEEGHGETHQSQRISKLRWIRERDNVAKLRCQSRRISNYLTLSLTALQSVQR